MIELLFGLIFAEMTLTVLSVFNTSWRRLVIMGLDRHKRARGTIVVKIVAGTMFLLMVATAYNVLAMPRRWIQVAAEVNPMDQVLLAKHLLEASLMGMDHSPLLRGDRKRVFNRRSDAIAHGSPYEKAAALVDLAEDGTGIPWNWDTRGNL